jgi:YCII-related domain
VRCRDGEEVITADGPAAETREQLTCFFTVDCKGQAQATEVATKVPPAWYGIVEVRPVWEKQPAGRRANGSPAVVLGREPLDQRGDLGTDRRPSRPVRCG